jgi:hypothetical protein
MTKTQRILATLSFVISLGGVACDADASARVEPRAALGPVAAVDVSSEDPSGDGCGCGNYADDDGDGGCDRATSGECRRGRSGRCPCGGGCSGCS